MDEPVQVRGRGLKVHPLPTWGQFWRLTLGGAVVLVLGMEYILSWRAPLSFIACVLAFFTGLHALTWWHMRRQMWRWVERSLRGEL